MNEWPLQQIPSPEYLPLLRELDEKLEEWRAFYQEAGYAGSEQDFFNHELRGSEHRE